MEEGEHQKDEEKEKRDRGKKKRKNRENQEKKEEEKKENERERDGFAVSPPVRHSVRSLVTQYSIISYRKLSSPK